MNSELCKRLIKIRKELGLTQVEAAKLSGITQGAYSRIESNAVGTSKHLPQIATALGVNLEWLANGNGKMYGTSDDPLTRAIQEKIATINSRQSLEALSSIIDQMIKSD